MAVYQDILGLFLEVFFGYKGHGVRSIYVNKLFHNLRLAKRQHLLSEHYRILVFFVLIFFAK